MSDFKLEFTLKQHTPLIHFQHEQAGATLRATEVKAKLDRFLVSRLFDNDFQKCKKHLIGYEPNEERALEAKFKEGFRALHYKLSLPAPLTRTYQLGYPKRQRGEMKWDDQFPGFFANMGEENAKNPKHFSFSESDLDCRIAGVDTELLARLKNSGQLFSEFFMRHNFGTRQSKGYGSFSLVSFDGRTIAGIPLPNAYYFEVNRAGPPNPEVGAEMQRNGYAANEQSWLANQYGLFEQIDLFYRTLRSGINLPIPGRSFYFKSLMFFYAREQNQQWDKKTIRSFFYSQHPRYQEIQHSRTSPGSTVKWSPEGEGRNRLIFRDLLGLATEQAWHAYRDTIEKSGKDASNVEIERLKSPLLFKPISTANGWKVFILPQDLPPRLLGASISVTSKEHKGKGALTLKIPERFSTGEYLSWAISYFNRLADEDGRPFAEYEGREQPRELRAILRIYKQLNTQNR